MIKDIDDAVIPDHVFSAPHEIKTQFAENLKERIYSTITLLAVIVVLWREPTEHSIVATIASIAGTVGALWLATIISHRLSYRAVHGTVHTEHQYRELFFTTSGLLTPAIAPIILVIFSATDLISIKTALFLSLGTLLFSLFIFSLLASRRVYKSKLKILLISLIEVGLGFGVIFLKLFVE